MVNSLLIENNIMKWEKLLVLSKKNFLSKILQLDEKIQDVMKHNWNRFSSRGWKVITVKKIHHCNEKSSLWWKFNTLMKIYQSADNSLILGNFIIWWKTHHCDENWLFLWDLIGVIKYINRIKIHHYDVNL